MKNKKTNFSSSKITVKYDDIVQKYGKEPVDEDLKNLNTEFFKKLFDELEYQDELFALRYPYLFGTDWEYDEDSDPIFEQINVNRIVSAIMNDFRDEKAKKFEEMQNKYYEDYQNLLEPYYLDMEPYIPDECDIGLEFILSILDSFIWYEIDSDPKIDYVALETKFNEYPEEYNNPKDMEEKFWLTSDGTNIKRIFENENFLETYYYAEMIEDHCSRALNENINSKDSSHKKETNAFDSDIVKHIINLLRDPDKNVRKEAANTLGIIAHPDGVEHLINSLNDPEERVVLSVVGALGKIGDERAIKPLKNHLHDKIVVSNEVTEALKKFGSKGEETIKNYWKKKDEERVQKANLKSLKRKEIRRIELSHEKDEKQKTKRDNEKKRNSIYEYEEISAIYGDEEMGMCKGSEDFEKMVEDHCSKEESKELLRTELSDDYDDLKIDFIENIEIKDTSSSNISSRERTRRLTQRLIDENDEYMDDIIAGLYGKK